MALLWRWMVREHTLPRYFVSDCARTLAVSGSQAYDDVLY